jgi:arylsulfatase A-like enzyme
VTNTAVAPEFGFGQGFDVYKESGAELSNAERRKRLGSVFDADTLNDLAFPWLEVNAEGPFFLYMHSVDPHAPYMPPEEFDRYYTEYEGDVDGSQASVDALKDKRWRDDPEGVKRLVALYDGEIRFNDHEIGRLLDEMERLGVLDDTLVVFLSDHGEELYDRGTSGHGHLNLHRELTQVPLIFRLPGVIPAGRRVAPMVSGLDVMPTVLDLLGIAVPEQAEGRSLVPLIQGGEAPDPLLYAFRVKQVKDLSSLRTDEYLFIEQPTGKRALYDVRTGEQEDLFPGLPETGKRMWEKRLGAFRQRRAECEINLRARQGDETLDIPDELKERLRALGYLK